jgi:hypothetical protein
MSDDTDFTEDELRSMAAGLALMEAERHVFADGGAVGDDEGNDRKVLCYERVPIKGAVPHGGYRLPHHAVRALGNGDPHAAGRVLVHLFGVSGDDPTIVPPEAVRQAGGGDIRVGHRVLQRFVERLRQQGAQPDIPQPDGNHGRVVR